MMVEQFKEHHGFREFGIPETVGERLVEVEHKVHNSQRRKAQYNHTGMQRYPYIPLPFPVVKTILRTTVKQFKLARGRSPRTFLEVGCGFGIVTHYAQTRLRLRSTGIDIVPDYVELSKEYLRGEYLVADALKFKQYANYDVVYFYQPFINHKLIKQFCTVLAERCTGFVAPIYGLHGTPFQYERPETERDEKFRPTRYAGDAKFPFIAPYNGQPFAPFDGQTKQLVYGDEAQYRRHCPTWF